MGGTRKVNQQLAVPDRAGQNHRPGVWKDQERSRPRAVRTQSTADTWQGASGAKPTPGGVRLEPSRLGAKCTGAEQTKGVGSIKSGADSGRSALAAEQLGAWSGRDRPAGRRKDSLDFEPPVLTYKIPKPPGPAHLRLQNGGRAAMVSQLEHAGRVRRTQAAADLRAAGRAQRAGHQPP